MKRSWLGFFLLLVLLGLSLLSTWAMGQACEPITENLLQASEEGLREDWGRAALFVAKARQDWESCALLRTMLTDHGPMEDMDALFCLLETYGISRENVAFSAICREMAEKIQAMGEAHSLVWENIL